MVVGRKELSEAERAAVEYALDLTSLVNLLLHHQESTQLVHLRPDLLVLIFGRAHHLSCARQAHFELGTSTSSEHLTPEKARPIQTFGKETFSTKGVIVQLCERFRDLRFADRR